MRNLDQSLENKKIDYAKLLKYGFINNDDNYIFEKLIYNNRFKVVIEISKTKKISKVIDLSVDEEYILVDVKDSSGDFVGNIKEEYENILNDIVKNCTSPNVFKSKQAKDVIKYIKEKYNDDLEFLWEKFDNNAIWRNKVNNKWYGLLITLNVEKLGINKDEVVDIIDLRYQKEDIEKLVDNEKIFKGYHMNKNHWITIKLDGSVDIKEIYKLIDNSYELSKNKN